MEISGKEEAFSNMSGVNEVPSQENLVLYASPSSDPNDLSDVPKSTNGNKNWNVNIRKIKIDFATKKRLQE